MIENIIYGLLTLMLLIMLCLLIIVILLRNNIIYKDKDPIDRVIKALDIAIKSAYGEIGVFIALIIAVTIYLFTI